ncbi:MAG: hypothetical protein QM776_12795 [Rhodocyclaceae bacterium]
MNPVVRGVLLTILGIAYLSIAHIGATVGEPAWLVVLTGCMPLSVASLIFLWGTRWRWPLLCAIVVVAWLLVLNARDLVAHSLWLYYLQDTGSNLLGCAFFARTLRKGEEALCTRMARYAHNGGMPATVKRYCDSLTWLWALYFGACAAIGSVLFLSGHVREWSWFANVLNWPLTISLLIVELPIRMLVVPARDRASLINSIRGVMAANAAERAAKPSRE